MDKENIEAIVPLLPMQQSFLWHSLHTRSGSGVIQLRCTLKGIIDPDKLQSAWDRVVSQHQALRTTVHWRAVKQPVQIVHKQVHSPIAFTHGTTDAALSHYLETDKNTTLDSSRVPAYRIAVFQDQVNRCHLVWSLSHIILDGWSCALIIDDWVAQYSALIDERPISPQPSPPLNEYIRWMNSQDRDELLLYWKHYLPADNMPPSRLPPSPQPVNDEQATAVCISASLGRVEFSEVQHNLRLSGLGLGSLLQGALALAIRNQHNKGNVDENNVLFSTTVSGRHIDLPEAEKRVGMMINVVPVCVSFDGTATVIDWLKGIQTRFYSSLPHSHVSASDIQACRPGRRSPFDTLLVLENQPIVSSTDKLQISDFKSGIISDMANTLLIIPGEELHLEWRCRGSLAEKVTMERTLASIVTLLEQIPRLLGEPLFVLDQFVPNEDVIPAHEIHSPASDNTTESYHHHAGTDSASTDVSPVRALERVLTDIWCEVLNRDQIDRDASFFDLGGSSFQALQMFEKIEQQLEVKLPATSLFDAPTVATIAALIESDQHSLWWTSVIEINRSGTKAPLFIPYEQTDMLMYRHLCAELGPDQPVYGLQISAVSKRKQDSLAELVYRIKHLQPDGPYLLAGLSGAGLVAWEIAQQLQKERRPVAMLALLDTYGPDFPHLLPPLRRLSSVALFILGQMVPIMRRVVELSLSAAQSKWMMFNSRTDDRDSDSARPDSPTSQASKLKTARTGRAETTPAQGVPNLIYQEQVKRDYELSGQLVHEVSRGKPKAIQWFNHIVLAMTKWRFRSFSAQMALVVYTQGLLLEYCREILSRTGNSTLEKMSVRRALIDGSLCIDKNMPETQVQLDRYRAMYAELQPYDGHVLYCKASQRPPGVVDDQLSGWKELLTNDPVIHTIPGDHSSILKYPNVRVLAEVLVNDMERATRIYE